MSVNIWKTEYPENQLMQIMRRKIPNIVVIGTLPWSVPLKGTLHQYDQSYLDKAAVRIYNLLHMIQRYKVAGDPSWIRTIRDRYTDYYVDLCALLLRLLIMSEFWRHTNSWSRHFLTSGLIEERARQLDQQCLNAARSYRNNPKRLFDIYYAVVIGRHASLMR